MISWISVDEALTADRVDFKDAQGHAKDVYVYLENFIRFPVGQAVPSGYYDRPKLAWVGSASGRVIKVWNVSGAIKVDVTGDNVDDNVVTNYGATMGFTIEEVATLGSKYAASNGASATLWRVPINHMTPWDFNWPVEPPHCEGAACPKRPDNPPDIPPICTGCCGGGGGGGGPANSENTKAGSIIGCDSQSLGEEAKVPGTPYSLHYDSARMPGSAGAREVKVPLTDANVHSQLGLIKATVAIAGRRHEQTFTPVAPATTFAPNLSWTFTWDGLDVAGRPVVGAQDATVTVTAHYRAAYVPVEFFGAYPSPQAALVASDRAFVPYTTSFVVPLRGRLPEQAWSMGGWTLNERHYYDVTTNRLYLGSGGLRPGAAELPIITRLMTSATGDARGGVAVGPNGDVFVADAYNHKILRIDAQGTVTTVVGSGVDPCYAHLSPNDNETDATLARLSWPEAVAVGPDGSLYIASSYGSSGEQTVRKATPLKDADGIATGKYSIATIAGSSCSPGSTGDGGPATSAKLNAPTAVALGQDGSIYIAEQRRVRRIDSAGLITTVAGNGGGGVSGDRSGEGKLAKTVAVNPTDDVAVGPDGTLLIASGYDLVSVDTNGVLHYLNAPHDNSTPVIDGVPLATQSVETMAIAARPDGSFVFDDDDWQRQPAGFYSRERIRSVDPSGIVTTIAATSDTSDGHGKTAPTKGLAIGEGPPSVKSLAVAPNGDVIALSGGNVYRIELLKEQAATTCGDANAAYHVVSGEQIFCFDRSGRHLRTINARTGAALLTFGYGSGAVSGGCPGTGPETVACLVDRDGGLTVVTKLSSPSRYEITAPYGQKTKIALDANGYATSISDALASMTLVPMANGLLDKLNDRNGNLFDFAFDSAGYLISDANALGAQILSRDELSNGRKVTHTTPLGRKTYYETTIDDAGVLTHVATLPNGTTEVKKSYPSGLQTRKDPDGTETETEVMLDTTFSASRLASRRSITKLPSNTLSSTTWTAICKPDKPDNSPTTTQLTAVALGTAELKCDANNPSVLAANAPPHTKTVTTYDSTGETITTTSPEGRVSVTKLDAQGRLVSTARGGLTPVVITPIESGEFEHKAWKRTQGSRVLETLEYQPKGTGTPPVDAGFVKQIADALGQKTGFSRDLFGRVKTQVDGKDTTLAAETVLGWDKNGNLNLVTPAGQPSHGLLYDVFNSLKQYTPPDVQDLTGTAKVTTYSPTSDRDPGTDTLPGNAQIIRSYVSAPINTGQLEKVTLPTGVINYEYFPSTDSTAAGKLKSIKGPYGVDLAFTYDGSLQTSTTWAGITTGAIKYEYYDQSLRLKSETVQVSVNNTVSSVPIYFGYDTDQLITCASATSCSPSTAALDIERGDRGQVKKLSLGSVVETFEYSDTAADLPNQAHGELRKQTIKHGNTVIAEFEYDAEGRRRDSLGRIKFKKETLRNRTGGASVVTDIAYTYDALNRLKTEKVGTAAVTKREYDGNGNLSKLTSPSLVVSTTVVDAQDRLESISSTAGGFSFTYGPNGEVTTKSINPATGASSTFALSYDAAGTLKSYASTASGGITIDYVVDGMGRRVARKLNGNITHRWLYRDDLNPIAELDAAGAVVSRFVYASRQNTPDFMIRDGKTYRIISDHLGSPRMVVNVDDLTDIPYRMDYSATGVAAPVGGTSPSWLPFGFAGGLYDDATKLLRFGARDYDPAIGRWLSKDPIAFKGGQANLYVYVFNDPVNRIDPEGLASCLLQTIGMSGTMLGTGIVCATIETGIGAIACVAGMAATVAAVDAAKDACKEPEPRPPVPCK